MAPPQGYDLRTIAHRVQRNKIDNKSLTQYYKNVLAANNTTNPNYQVDFSAEAFVIDGIMLENISGTADLTTDLRSGLTEQASTWYYLWIFTEGTGSSYTWRFDTDATTPTYPDGFTKGRVITDVYNGSGQDFRPYSQRNEYVIFDTVISLNAGGAATKTEIDVSSIIPANSNRFLLFIDSVSTGTGTRISSIYEDIGGVSNYPRRVAVDEQVASGTGRLSSNTTLVTSDNQHYYYINSSSTFYTVSHRINAYYINL
jgi:hypothetical protein